MSSALARSLEYAFTIMLEQVHKDHERPLAINALHCQLACLGQTDNPQAAKDAANASRQQVEECMAKCNAAVEAFRNAQQQEVAQIQTVVQRGIAQCTDTARQSLPASPSERQVNRAQQNAEACAKKSFATAEALVPKAEQRLREHAKKLMQATSR